MRYWEKDSTTAILKFFGNISEWYNNANDFESTIREISAKYKNLEILTHCYGGSVFEGNTMFNCLQRSSLYVIIDLVGISASMMTIVMLAANKVIAAPNIFVMVHGPSGYCEGTSADMFSYAKLMKSMEKNFTAAYLKKTGAKADVVAGWFDGTDHWFDASEAKALGLIDEVYEHAAVEVVDNYKPDETTPIINLYNRFAAVAKTEGPISEAQDLTPNFLNMKKDLIAKFGLTGVTEASSDTAIIDAVNAKIADLEAKNRKLEADQETQAKALVKSTIDRLEATASIKFTDAQNLQLTAIGEKAGVAALEMMGGLMVPQATSETTVAKEIVDVTASLKPELKTVAGGVVAGDRATWDWDKWQKEDGDGLEAMATSNYAAFDKLYFAKYKVNAPK